MIDGLYIGPIQHDPIMCKPGRCPGDSGCWCADCERGEHPWRGIQLDDWLARVSPWNVPWIGPIKPSEAKVIAEIAELSELEKRWLWGDR
jgi:hypothetical protein